MSFILRWIAEGGIIANMPENGSSHFVFNWNFLLITIGSRLSDMIPVMDLPIGITFILMVELKRLL